MKRIILYTLAILPLCLLSQPTSKVKEFKAEKLFLDGLAQYEGGNYRTAISIFDQVINMNPNHQRVYELRGESYFKMGQYDYALADYEKATDQHPRNAELRNSMGVSAAYLKQYRAAASYFYEALQIDPEHQGAKTNLQIANRKLVEQGEMAFQESDYLNNPVSWNDNNQNNNQGNNGWDLIDENTNNYHQDDPLFEDDVNTQTLETWPGNNENNNTKPDDRNYNKGRILIGSQNDPYITIERVRIIENSTRITFAVQNITGKVFPIEIDRRNSADAFYLTDRNFQKIYKMKSVSSLNGWPNSPYPLRPGETKIFTVEFEKLDDEVTFFHILEGKSDRPYSWDFWDVELKEYN
ncbi:MAG: tetratricopeptide repeat protein [Bacteroidetes bacterium]|nr:tetratricopeptide repeat protein [Bacteroidota bacterium]